jgi:uncharacterized protein YbaP (TraB family)
MASIDFPFKHLGVLFVIGFCLQACSQHHQPASKQSAASVLWEVRGKELQRPVYLYGTFHLMCAGEMPFADTLQILLKASDALILEMDLDDPATALGGMMGMQMKGGKTLRDFYTPDEYQRINKYFQDSLQMKLKFWERMMPVLLEPMLMMRWMQCIQVISPETKLMEWIKADEKPVLGLETILEQKAVLEKIPLEDQARSLLATIDSMAVQQLEFQRMKSAYLNQQLDVLEGMSDDFSAAELKSAMLDDRNTRWLERLPGMWKQGGMVVAVGAGHLPGKQGLIEGLRRMGYRVQPIIQ